LWPGNVRGSLRRICRPRLWRRRIKREACVCGFRPSVERPLLGCNGVTGPGRQGTRLIAALVSSGQDENLLRRVSVTEVWPAANARLLGGFRPQWPDVLCTGRRTGPPARRTASSAALVSAAHGPEQCSASLGERSWPAAATRALGGFASWGKGRFLLHRRAGPRKEVPLGGLSGSVAGGRAPAALVSGPQKTSLSAVRGFAQDGLPRKTWRTRSHRSRSLDGCRGGLGSRNLGRLRPERASRQPSLSGWTRLYVLNGPYGPHLARAPRHGALDLRVPAAVAGAPIPPAPEARGGAARRPAVRRLQKTGDRGQQTTGLDIASRPREDRHGKNRQRPVQDRKCGGARPQSSR